MRNAVFGVTTALIAVLLVAGGFLARVVTEPETEVAASATEPPQDGLAEAFDGSLLAEIAAILGEEFVDENAADPELLREGAIQGLLNALNDPHTTYIDPQTFALLQDDFEGSFQGIGATVSRQGNYVVIVRPIPDTPAERAGLLAGDIILAVDGADAENWSVEEAVLRIRGQRGTTVDLTVRHPDGVEETLTIERDEIPVESVITTPPGGALVDDNGDPVEDVGYIYLRQFARNSVAELTAAVQQAEADGKTALIIDVRSNPGGLLSETVAVSDMFLDGGTIFGQTDREGNTQFANASPGMAWTLPVVLLQDEFSASGSELFAAALQENGRAVVVGTRSFGKGTVNTSIPLSNGGAVYVSIARWVTPDGHQIEGNGVTPDFPITLTLEDIEAGRDIALLRAIAIARNGGVIPADLPTSTPPPEASETATATATAAP